MTTYVKIETLPTYPDTYVSRRTMNVIKQQGLIEPILIMPDGEVHWTYIEHFEAFRRLVEELKQTGVKATDMIIVCYYANLSADEKAEYSLHTEDTLL